MALKAAALVGAAAACGLASRLHRLNEPPSPVFDEYHVGRFVIWFDERMDSFDLHPPLLKMLYREMQKAIPTTPRFPGRSSTDCLRFSEKVSRGLGHAGREDCGYGASDPFVADHTVPYENCSMWELRFTPAVCGGLLAPVFMLTYVNKHSRP